MSTVNLEAVRFKARKVAPYFGTVIWGLRPVAVPGCGTFSVTDDGQFVYDPDVPWTFEEQVGVFIHELHHVVLRHAERSGNRDRKMWNIATDIEINNSLRRGGVVLPKGALMPEQFGLPENQAAEIYYAAIQAMVPDRQPKFPDTHQPGTGRCGSVAGQREEFEPEPDGNANQAGHNTGGQQQGKTEVEIQAMRKRVAEEVLKDIGNAPQNLVDWARSMISPTIPWQSMLRAAVKRAINNVAGGATDYTYSRTNDRTLDPDLILPTLITKKPEVCVIVDTSGSISRQELDEAISEVAGVLRAHANRMTVMAVDHEVHEVHTVAVGTNIETLKFSGGGGTNLVLGFDHAMKSVRPKPNIIIVFTDAYTPWPKRKPDAEVVVCLTRAGDENRVPKWARSLRVGKGADKDGF